MNKFTGVLLLGTALLAGCVDREGYYNSVKGRRARPWTDVSAGATCITLQR